MEIYLIRHAQSVGNAQMLMQGDLDYSLSQSGIEQAKQLISVLPEFDKIYSSRLLRAAETAKIATGREPQHIKDFAELDIGAIAGKPYDQNMDDHDKRISYFYLEHEQYHQEVDGESVKDFILRVSRAFAQLIDSTDQESQIAIFCHGGTMRAILHKYLGIMDSEEADFKNCEIVILNYKDGLFELKDRIYPDD